MYILVIVMAIWMLFPFYWAINSSFKSEAQLAMTPTTMVPRSPVTGEISFYMRNYEAVFNNQAFLRAIVNSLIVAGSVTLLSLSVGAFAGFALGKLRYRGKSPTLYVILAMTMFPQIAVLSGLYAMIAPLPDFGHSQPDPDLLAVFAAFHGVGADGFLPGTAD